MRFGVPDLRGRDRSLSGAAVHERYPPYLEQSKNEEDIPYSLCDGTAGSHHHRFSEFLDSLGLLTGIMQGKNTTTWSYNLAVWNK